MYIFFSITQQREYLLNHPRFFFQEEFLFNTYFLNITLTGIYFPYQLVILSGKANAFDRDPLKLLAESTLTVTLSTQIAFTSNLKLYEFLFN